MSCVFPLLTFQGGGKSELGKKMDSGNFFFFLISVAFNMSILQVGSISDVPEV